MDTERRWEIPQINLSLGSNQGLWRCEEAMLPDAPTCHPLGVITFQVSYTTDVFNLPKTQRCFPPCNNLKIFQSVEIEGYMENKQANLKEKKKTESTHPHHIFLISFKHKPVLTEAQCGLCL